MEINLCDLEKKQMYIMGSKHKSEHTFFLQVKDLTPKEKDKLLWKFHNSPQIDYFFYLVEIPYKIKDAPF